MNKIVEKSMRELEKAVDELLFEVRRGNWNLEKRQNNAKDIRVEYVHHTQAVPVKGADWKIVARNQQLFAYRDARKNNEPIKFRKEAHVEAARGDY